MLASQVEARTLSQLPFLQDLQAPAEVLDSIVSEEAAYHKLSLAERSLSLQQQKDKKEGYYKESPRSKDLSSKVSKAQETLDAAKASTTKAINTHYRKASRTLHPDKSTGSRVEFERLVDARSCLVDPRLRHLYVEQMNQVVQTLGIKYAQTCHGPWVLKNLRLLQENGVSMSSTPTSPPVKRLTGGITSDIPRKARVQVRNHAERRLHVTLPLPRNLVSYATYCTNVQVVASENPSEAQPTTVALLQGTEILQRLEKDQYEVTVDDVMLPMSNPTVYIRWFATLQVNGKTLTSPYSMETEVDLTSPEERLRLLDFQATQELAKQRLSDIQTLLPTLVRHTSPHDDTLEVLQAKYDRLHSTLARGQSTLTQLQLLLRKETHHNSSSAAKIQQALQEALELAVAAKARLQVRLDENSKRGSLKEFKGRVADLLEQGKAATWLQAATRSDMEALGGEPNRLYQLLIEGRGLEVDPDTLGAAATRSDLFTEKQLQALQTRQQEVATKVAQETQRALEDAKKQRELEKQQREMQRQALATKALQDRQREELRARIMAEQSYAQAAAAPGDSLPSGTLVEVYGLTSTEGAPLNGTCGLIEFKRGDRYIVRCDLDGKFRSIPANKIRERQESTATGTTDVESPTWTCAVCTFVHEKALAKETACNMCQTARGATTYTEAVAKSASAQQPQTIFVSRKNSVKVPKRASLVSSSKSASLTLAQKPTTTTTLTKKTTTAADTRKTKHRCKHGTECRYLRKGPNVCTFYHPPHEVASVPQPSKRIFIKPSVVGWIIGKNGNHIQELMELTGADIWVDQKDMGPDELRIVNITGNQQQVDLAVQVVKDTVTRVTIQDGAYSSAPEEPSEAPDAVDTSISTLGSASPGLITCSNSSFLTTPTREVPAKPVSSTNASDAFGFEAPSVATTEEATSDTVKKLDGFTVFANIGIESLIQQYDEVDPILFVQESAAEPHNKTKQDGEAAGSLTCDYDSDAEEDEELIAQNRALFNKHLPNYGALWKSLIESQQNSKPVVVEPEPLSLLDGIESPQSISRCMNNGEDDCPIGRAGCVDAAKTTGSSSPASESFNSTVVDIPDVQHESNQEEEETSLDTLQRPDFGACRRANDESDAAATRSKSCARHCPENEQDSDSSEAGALCVPPPRPSQPRSHHLDSNEGSAGKNMLPLGTSLGQEVETTLLLGPLLEVEEGDMLPLDLIDCLEEKIGYNQPNLEGHVRSRYQGAGTRTANVYVPDDTSTLRDVMGKTLRKIWDAKQAGMKPVSLDFGIGFCNYRGKISGTPWEKCCDALDASVPNHSKKSLRLRMDIRPFACVRNEEDDGCVTNTSQEIQIAMRTLMRDIRHARGYWPNIKVVLHDRAGATNWGKFYDALMKDPFFKDEVASGRMLIQEKGSYHPSTLAARYISLGTVDRQTRMASASVFLFGAPFLAQASEFALGSHAADKVDDIVSFLNTNKDLEYCVRGEQTLEELQAMMDEDRQEQAEKRRKTREKNKAAAAAGEAPAKRSTRFDAAWENMHQQLISFKQKTGHLSAKQNSADLEERKLAKWISDQRGNKKMPEDQIAKLNELGFVWSALDAAWEEMRQQLISFKQKTGHLSAKENSADLEERKLGKWISNQRQNEKMPEDRIAKLNELGFVWNAREAAWEDMHQQLRSFEAKTGHLSANQNSTDPEERKLATWISKQRENEKMPEDRIAKLNELGFVWNAHDAAWEDMHQQLISFKQKTGNLSANHRSADPEERKLAKWISRQRGNKNMRADRIAKLNELGFVWKVK